MCLLMLARWIRLAANRLSKATHSTVFRFDAEVNFSHRKPGCSPWNTVFWATNCWVLLNVSNGAPGVAEMYKSSGEMRATGARAKRGFRPHFEENLTIFHFFSEMTIVLSFGRRVSQRYLSIFWEKQTLLFLLHPLIAEKSLSFRSSDNKRFVEATGRYKQIADLIRESYLQ